MTNIKTYIIKIKKSKESNNSKPNRSVIKNPKNAANKAAAPPEIISACWTREYFNLVYVFSCFIKYKLLYKVKKNGVKLK